MRDTQQLEYMNICSCFTMLTEFPKETKQCVTTTLGLALEILLSTIQHYGMPPSIKNHSGSNEAHCWMWFTLKRNQHSKTLLVSRAQFQHRDMESLNSQNQKEFFRHMIAQN